MLRKMIQRLKTLVIFQEILQIPVEFILEVRSMSSYFKLFYTTNYHMTMTHAIKRTND